MTLPLLLLVVISAFTAWGVRENYRSATIIAATQERLTQLWQVEASVEAMQNATRGFVITGAEAQLREYGQASDTFDQRLNAYITQADDAANRAQAASVRADVTHWRESSAQTAMALARQSTEKAAQWVRRGQGIRQLSAVRRDLLALQQKEQGVLDAALARNLNYYRQVQWVALIGSLLGGALLLYSARRATRKVTDSVQELTRDTALIMQGQYELQVRRVGVREFDHLARQFQSMAGAVSQREQALERTQQSLEASNQNLQRSNRELERFAYIASHDLQEPLRTIASYTELLQRRYAGQLDARADTYMNFTVNAATRLKNMIQDLLTFSRVHQPGRTFTQVDTAQLVGQVLDELQVKVAHARAQVQVDDLPTLTGNAELLHHIFLNLLMNAVKFRSPERPARVRVWAERAAPAPGEGWVFHVQDNGIGIDPAYFARIFEVFQRLHNHEQFQGSGVGLAVIRSAAEQHGGRVWLDSTPGQGSTFHVFLPDQPPVPDTGAPFRPS